MRMNVPINPGEFFDKLTILVNKVYNCKNKEQVSRAVLQLCELAQGMQPVGGDWWERSQHALLELRDTNKKLWELEETVRTEKDPGNRLLISDGIRELNATRAECKGVIDVCLDGLKEVKDYATNEDSD